MNAGDVEQKPALLDVPQPLGFLPTRRFWDDPENKRLAAAPVFIAMWLLMFVVMVAFEPSLWAAGVASLAVLGIVVLVHGLFERYIRNEAKRRFHSGLGQAALAEDSDSPDLHDAH